MKKIFTILILSSLFAGELEVEGDLKVSGNIDAQNNPIKNVGIPQELTDAINGNVLQDALRDDTQYQYKMILIRLSSGLNYTTLSGHEYGVDSEYDWTPEYSSNIISFLESGWLFHKELNLGEHSGVFKFLLILKRPIEE